MTPLPPFDSDRLGRFDAFVAGFQGVFTRSDQFQRFRAYLRGLLEPSDRKNVEAIAGSAAAIIPSEADLGQALQHFVAQSPWDASRLLAEYRCELADVAADPAAVWVVHDGVFVKKGRHSVGVQRQFARSVGRKLNCQLAVVVAQVGPAGYFPLAARLYLPSLWLREYKEVAEKTVPEDHRQPTSKTEIALGLIDELRAEGRVAAGVVAEDGYASAYEFTEGLSARRLAGPASRTAAPWALGEARGRFDWLKAALGLDHFEGRSWVGWHHHVSLVFAAYGFLAAEGRSADLPPFPPRR